MMSEFIYAADWATHKVAVCGHQNPDIKEIEIPETIEVNGEQMPVAVVNLSENKKLEKVVIPATVEAIAGEAFAGLKKLKSLTFSGDFCTIGLDAFKDCKKLSEVNLSDACLKQYYKLFEGTPCYEELEKKANELLSAASEDKKVEANETIVDNVLQTVNTAVDYVVPEGVKIIEEGAFTNSPDLRSVVLPESIEELNRAFKDCQKLEKVTFPSHVKDGMQLTETFKGCTALRELDLPEGIVSVTDICSGCTSLKRVHFPSTLNMTRLGQGSFWRCKSLVEINIPVGVESIDKAFNNLESLEHVEIADGVKNIDTAFKNCTALKEVALPESVVDMKSAFEGCKSLEIVNIPSHVQSITYTFESCTSLKTIVIPVGVKNMMGAFNGCSSLEEVTIPDTVSRIDYAFQDCTALKSISIPESVIKMDDAFVGCKALETIENNSKEELMGSNIKGSAFYENQLETENGAVYFKDQLMKVPEDTIEFATREGTRIITKKALQGCSKLVKLDLSESVTTIEKNAAQGYWLNGCNALKELVIRGYIQFAYDGKPILYPYEKSDYGVTGAKVLSKVICLSTRPMAINVKRSTTIFVPEQSIEGYQKAIEEVAHSIRISNFDGVYKAIKPLSAIKGGNFIPFTPSAEK